MVSFLRLGAPYRNASRAREPLSSRVAPAPPRSPTPLGVAVRGSRLSVSRDCGCSMPNLRWLKLSTFVEPIGRLLLDFDLDMESVYEQLGARGVVLAEADQDDLRRRRQRLRWLNCWGCPGSSPLLQVRRRVFDADGTYRSSCRVDSYRGDIFNVTVHNRVALARAGVSTVSRSSSAPDPPPANPSSTVGRVAE